MADSGPRTIVLPGDGSQAASYKLAPGIFQYVESVLVEVDASAAGDVRPTLRIAEPSGVVIATKRQGETIPAGDTGSATWALRLDDERPAGGSGLQFDKDPQEGDWFRARVTTNGPVDPGSGVAYGTIWEDDSPNGPLWRAKSGGKTALIALDEGRHILAFASDQINVQVFGGPAIVWNPGNLSFTLDNPTDVFTFFNHLGQKVFEIRSNGSLHGKTGQTLTFDL